MKKLTTLYTSKIAKNWNFLNAFSLSRFSFFSYFIIIFFSFNVNLEAQNISYEVDIDDIYSSECADCVSGPDYRFFFRLFANGGEVANWNPAIDDSPVCGWIGTSNLNYYANGNASFSSFINLNYRAFEDDDAPCDNPCFFCTNGGPDDGTCVSYASANGNITMTGNAANTWHYNTATRSCTDDGVTITWGVYYSYRWNFVPVLAPAAPSFTGTGCALALVPTNSTQAAVTWYWQTSPTGTSTTNPSSNPPAVSNGTTTFYLRGRGDNNGVWGPASSALTLTKSCNFWCQGEGPVNVNPVGAFTNNGRTSSSPAGNGLYQHSFVYTGDFATNSLIIGVNTTVTDFGSNMELFNGVTSTSLVNGNASWTNWNNQNPLNTFSLATDNALGSTIDPSNVSVEVCACKPANNGAIISSTGTSACPDEAFTLTHPGSTSSKLDEQGYGEELRWFTGGCGTTQVGTGLVLSVTGPGTETSITYYARFYTNGSPCGACAVYTVTYVDNTAPTISCSNETEFKDASCGWLVPNYIPNATISDNCVAYGDLTITQSPAAGTYIANPGASQGVSISANDGYGNVNSCSFTVTLLDNSPPNAICQNFTLNLNSTGNGTVTGANVNNGSTDNCGVASLSVFPSTFDCSHVGAPQTVALTVTDVNGNTASCNATVTVVDNVAPVAICQNYTLVLNGSGNGTLTTANINNGSNDACGIASYSLSQTAFDCSHVGPNTVTLTVTDNNGNSSTCSSIVTVQDAPPTNAFAGSDLFSCLGASVTLGANPAIVGVGTWTWTGPGAVTYTSGNANTANAAVSCSVSGVYQGIWTITSNCASSSDTVLLGYNLPDVITTTALANGQCTSNGLNQFLHIFDASDGKILASVNDNGNNLGAVNVTILSVGNASTSTVCANGMGSYMGRSFRLFSSNTGWYGNTVLLRLYFTDAELNSLIANSHTTTPAPGWDPNGCEDDDDVNNIGDVYATKYAINGTPPGSPGGLFINPVSRGYDAQFMASYVDLEVTSFSDFYLHGSEAQVALPVELTEFTVKAINNQFIKLNWTTATEVNNAGFEIQRSTNGADFETISWSPGYNNSNVVHHYSYQDNEVVSGTYYYRLKQVDNDGQFEYSDIKSATIEGKNGFVDLSSFIPNPAENSSKLIFTLGSDAAVKIIMTDNLGRTMEVRDLNLKAGLQEVYFDLGNYASGTYITKIWVGNQVFLRKVIIKN